MQEALLGHSGNFSSHQTWRWNQRREGIEKKLNRKRSTYMYLLNLIINY